MFLQKRISSPQDFLQSQSLETVPVCTVWQYSPQSNTVCIHMCDECKISIDSGVCHRLWSISWSIVRAYLLTIKYRVVQFLPSTSISEQFERILVTILQQISFFVWSGGHRCREEILCKVVGSSWLLTHNIAPHISLHDQPYHKTMKKYEDLEGMVISLLSPHKFAIQTWFCNCPQYFCLFHTVFEYPKYKCSKERCWFHQIDFFVE